MSRCIHSDQISKPTHVLLSINDYQKLIGNHQSIVDLLYLSNAEDIDFNPPRLGDFSSASDLA